MPPKWKPPKPPIPPPLRGRPPKLQKRSGYYDLDLKIVSVIESRPLILGSLEVCYLVFPKLQPSEQAKSRHWPYQGGILCSPAWLVHWRLRVLNRRGLICMTPSVSTDTFFRREAQKGE